MVGAVRFELTTSCTRNKRATKLRYAPNQQAHTVANCRAEMQRVSRFRERFVRDGAETPGAATRDTARRTGLRRNWGARRIAPGLFQSFMQPEFFGLGTAVNTGAILLGGLVGRLCSRQLGETAEGRLRVFLAALTVWVGLSLTWKSFHGGLGAIARQFIVLLAALMLGKWLGKKLGLQDGMNQLGAFAGKSFAAENRPEGARFNDGFVSGTIVFCLAPLAIIGAAVDGLDGNYRPLVIKAAIDGLAAISFAAKFGWGVLLVVIPVIAYQGAVTLLVATVVPSLGGDDVQAVNAVAGMLVFCVALIMLKLKRVALGDYLPSLAVAPALTWLLGRMFP